jgi:glucosamine-6-phosphate deaminase
MARPLSSINAGWWDYTTLDSHLLKDAAKLTEQNLKQLSRPGFTIHFHDSYESFFLAEAMEYIKVWKESTASDPTGICGPIGPVRQLPLVAQLINDLQIDVSEGHFWGMDEWYVDGKELSEKHPLSFKKTDMEMCFNLIDDKLKMPEENIHFLNGENLNDYSESFDNIRCLVMQGGQGDTKHWAFNDPVERRGEYQDNPPSPEEYRKLKTRIVNLHPITRVQGARMAGGGVIHSIPSKAITVGPVETWKSEKISIWHPGYHDNPFGQRLTALMLSEKIADSAVPMSLLSEHPDVHFHYYREGIGNCVDHDFF